MGIALRGKRLEGTSLRLGAATVETHHDAKLEGVADYAADQPHPGLDEEPDDRSSYLLSW